jgi:hypothetical protein
MSHATIELPQQTNVIQSVISAAVAKLVESLRVVGIDVQAIVGEQ